jgi:hypothetical protein
LNDGSYARSAKDWLPSPCAIGPPQSLQLCLDVLGRLRQSVVDTRRALEDELAQGVEARSFARTYERFLPATEDQAALERELVDSLSQAGDANSQSLLAELVLLEQETRTLRDLLSGALSRASAPSRPVDWHRVRAAEEAHARDRTKSFSQL